MQTEEGVAEKGKEDLLHWHTFYKISSSSPGSPTTDAGDNVDQEFVVTDVAVPSKRLSLLSGNLPADEETVLRSYLSSQFFKGDGIRGDSLVTTVADQFMSGTPTQVYHKVISGSNNITNEDDNVHDSDIQFVVCFIIATASGLELFQDDLDTYANDLVPYLLKCMESVDISEYLKFAESWYDKNIRYMERCLQYFSNDLAILMCVGFCEDSVIISTDVPADMKKDIERFLTCCSLSPLFMETCLEFLPSCTSSSMHDLVTLTNGESINITYEDSKLVIRSKKSTTFCQECVDAMLQVKPPNPLKLRQIVESYKLKSIQYMNSFKRLMKEGEKDHYALYKAFLYLVTCGNGLVLLHNAKLQNSVDELSSSKAVTGVLETFIERMGGFSVLDTPERRNELKSKLLGT